MRPIRIAFQLGPQHSDYAGIRRAAVAAEELGVDIIYNWDHFFPVYGPTPPDGSARRVRKRTGPPPNGPSFECWTMLASLAEVTEKVQIGPLVSCNSYRNPQYLADVARTVDHISGGRVILGIGSGWVQRDYDAYGYEFGTVASRLDDLAAALPLIKRRLSLLNPPPLGGLPILIGGVGERRTLRIVAEHADIWHGFGNHDELVHRNAVLDRWCAEVGRDPAEIERAAVIGGDAFDDTSAGDEAVAAGVTQLTLTVGGPDYDLSFLEDWVAWRDERNVARAAG